MKHGLFVYGTLLSDEAQAGLIGERPRTPATTHGTLWRLPAGYPALVPGPDPTSLVHGQLVESLDEALLSLLDLYEGVDTGPYRRVVVPVTAVRRKGTTLAWAYVVDNPARHGGTPIANGRWRSRMWRR